MLISEVPQQSFRATLYASVYDILHTDKCDYYYTVNPFRSIKSKTLSRCVWPSESLSTIAPIIQCWLSSKHSHYTVRLYSDLSKWMMCNYSPCSLPNPVLCAHMLPRHTASTIQAAMSYRIMKNDLCLCCITSPESVLNQRWLVQFTKSAQ